MIRAVPAIAKLHLGAKSLRDHLATQRRQVHQMSQSNKGFLVRMNQTYAVKSLVGHPTRRMKNGC